MKIKVYAETSILEQIALGQSLDYVSPYSFQFLLGDKQATPDKWFCGEVELNLPSRDQAVMRAQQILEREAAESAAYYADRLSKLLALTWEAPQSEVLE